jgi:hypothetical protein
MSVLPRFFLFFCIFGYFSAMGFQKHYKKRFTRKSDKTIFFYHLFGFWAFLGEGSPKTRQKYRQKN